MVIDLSILENKVKYYFCPFCGNIVEVVFNSGNIPVCCGKAMQLLIPGISDGSAEKHIPCVEIKHGKVLVTVGSEPHPMTSEHHINWISLQTNQGVYRRQVFPSKAPQTCFFLHENEHVVAVFAYCNLHKLWMYEPAD